MVSHSGLITVMTRAARKAAPRLRRDFNEVEQLQVSQEGPGRLRLDGRQARRGDADRGTAHARAPTGAILTEEAGEIEGDPTKPRWIVDPLDGTINFLHGIPHFAISIAVEEQTADGAPRDHATAWSISR